MVIYVSRSIIIMDIYKEDGSTLDTKKVCFLIWNKRGDAAAVADLIGVLR